MKLIKTMLFGALALSLLTQCGDDDAKMLSFDASANDSSSGNDRDASTGVNMDAGMTDATTNAPDAKTVECNVPSDGFGTTIGRNLQDFRLNECDGNELHFYGDNFCDNSLTVLMMSAGWCSRCVRETTNLQAEIVEPYAAKGVRVIQVLVEDQSFSEPSLAFCNEWKNRFSLENHVVVDPAQITSIYFPANVLPSTLVVDRSGKIIYREGPNAGGLNALKTVLDAHLP